MGLIKLEEFRSKFSDKKWPFFLLLIVFSTSILGTYFYAEKSQFDRISIGFFSSFISYFLVLFFLEESKFKLAIYSLILIKVFLLFGIPQLSDDVYRFLWDGLSTINNINVYSHFPIDIQQREFFPNDLFQSLNSPEYYSVYPPLSQLFFAFCAMISGPNIHVFSFLLKLIFLAAEFGTIYFIFKILNQLKIPKHNLFIYAFNPLILIELSGNLHTEILAVFGLSGALYFLLKSSYFYSSFLLAIAICIKINPLIFLPFILYYLGWEKSKTYLIFLTLFCLLFFSPLFLADSLGHFLTSLDLYFRKFEFNASLYYFINFIATKFVGYNYIHIIGPLLSITSLIFILNFARKITQGDFNKLIRYSILGYAVYLLFSTTVHPWYISPILLLACFSDWKWPLVASAALWLSYYTYSNSAYSESIFILIIEYTFIFTFLYIELIKSQKPVISLS